MTSIALENGACGVVVPSVGSEASSFKQASEPAGRLFERKGVSPAERCFDVAIALVLLPFVLIVGMLIAVAIFLDSPGPVFYRSRRVGYAGRSFDMLKFRKMRRCATGDLLTRADDDRFTPIGKFLALTKLDELPQLWNVLKGEMRLVGPRPEVEPFVAQHAESYAEILTAVPGITGPAAIQFAAEGKLLADREDVTAFYCAELLPRKVDIDVAYVRNRTLAKDAALLLRTALTPLRRVTRLVHELAARPARTVYRELAYCSMGGAVLVVFALTTLV